jgi:hypothetical protein
VSQTGKSKQTEAAWCNSTLRSASQLLEQRTNGEAESFDKRDSQVGCKELTRKIRQEIWGRMLSALL